MAKVHRDPDCYCDACCRTADTWFEWRNGLTDDSVASGSRYWTLEHALADLDAAEADGLTILVRQPEETVVADVISLRQVP
jgi:hypothetical protein